MKKQGRPKLKGEQKRKPITATVSSETDAYLRKNLPIGKAIDRLYQIAKLSGAI